MNNSKRNIHNSGALGMLVRSGQIKKVEIDNPLNIDNVALNAEQNRGGAQYFKTQSGIEFSEQELLLVDPRECEPWKYANRLEDEMGNMDELVESIRKNKQLQPALVRPHSNPSNGFKYEIIFGRRRHQACLKLGINFLVIKKNISNINEAVATQDAENKLRKDISNYSNSLLYKKLLEDKIFKNEKELAGELRLTYSTFNDLMAYSKIPQDIVSVIPCIHELSNSMAIKIVNLINKSSKFHGQILKVAHQIGKTITSPNKLEKAIFDITSISSAKEQNSNMSKIIKASNGKKLFTVKINHQGKQCFVIDKNLNRLIDLDTVCTRLQAILEPLVSQSGAPD